jgi:serine phosphatase RsbU (regulator of sigma subunit)
VTAARLFGIPAAVALGRDLREVLLTSAGQRELLHRALARTAAGLVWTGIVQVPTATGRHQVTLHCEPLTATEPLTTEPLTPEPLTPEPLTAEQAATDQAATYQAATDQASPDQTPPHQTAPDQTARGSVPTNPAGTGVLVIARRALPELAENRLLPEAASLIGTTLDVYKTAREAADVAVPAFADSAAIFVSERFLAADELAPYAAGPAVVRRLVSRLHGQPADVIDGLLRPGEVLVFGDDSPSYRAMTTRCPVLFEQLDTETAERLRHRLGDQVIAQAYTSFLAVPLVARGTVLGSVTFARSATRAEFTPADILLADQLASRAAVSIDNARLYHQERRTASALQQGLLPIEPSIPPGLAVAHRYVPVGASIVGGDWHDIVPLTSGRAALIVGDAMGHGPEAAAMMVQLRTAAHTLADLELPPEEILGRLDKMATAMSAAPFATCIAAVIDPAESSCVIAKAGHLPPMLTLADGETRVLDLPPGLPIGLGTASFEATKVMLPPGATLALYTDGLVESRIRSLDDGLTALSDALTAALTRPGHTLDESCQQISSSLRQRGEDDITLVLARVLDCDS